MLFSAAGIYDGLHLRQLPMHILCHGQLAPGPHQIVVRIVDIEVQIPHQVSIQEAPGQLHRDGKYALRQAAALLEG